LMKNAVDYWMSLPGKPDVCRLVSKISLNSSSISLKASRIIG